MGPGGLTLRPVFQAPGGERGFFSLRGVGGRLLAGTYGTPRCFASSDGERWSDVSGEVTGAGESLFDIVETGAGIFGATERTGGIYQFLGSRWTRVFSAGDNWDNSYAGADFDGKFVTGFNEFGSGGSTRTLVVIGPPFETHILDGYNHLRVGVLGGTLYGVANKTGYEAVGFVKYLGGGSWQEVAALDGYAYGYKMAPVGGDLIVGLEPAAITRFTGSTVRRVVRVSGYQFIPQVIEHAGRIYAVASQPWRSGSGRGAVVDDTGAVLAQLDEPEAWCLESYAGDLFVGTRQNSGPSGRIYRSSSVVAAQII